MSAPSVDFDSVRTICAALPGVKDASGSRGVALKIGRRIMACKAINKSAEPNSLMVRLGIERRDALLAKDAGTYYLTDHYAPYPAVLVRMSRITPAALEELMVESWEFVRKEAK